MRIIRFLLLSTILPCLTGGAGPVEHGSGKPFKHPKGKLIVLQAYAGWCGSCGELMREMAALKKGMKWDYVVMSVDDEKKAIDEFFEKKYPDLKYMKKDVVWDKEGAYASELKVSVLPSLLLMRDGVVLWRVTGHPKKADFDKLKADGK